MTYLSEKHQQLSEGQQSGFMTWFDSMQFDRKVTAISLSLVVGVGAAAMGWLGEASDRVDFCVKTPTGGENCVDTNNRPYRMTRYHWQQWQKEGRPKQVRLNGIVKASNPYKPFWAMAAFTGFALAGWMLRHLQQRESQLTALEAIATNRDIAIAEIHAMQELELITHDHTVTIQQAELIAQSELHLTQMDAEDAIFEANTAGMTPEQKQQYIDFIRQQKTSYLQGSQTLQGTVTPKDKVEGEDREVLPSGATSWVNAHFTLFTSFYH